MTLTPELTSFTLRDIAGETLIQDHPYPVVAPRSLETLALVVRYAKTEGLRVLPLGTGSSFDSDFKLLNSKIVAVLSAGLTGIQKLSPTGFRVLSGTPLSRLFRGDVSGERKTIGGLIAGFANAQDEFIKALRPRVLVVEMMNGDGKLLRLKGPGAAGADDPGLAQAIFGSQGKMGMITAVELSGPFPLEVPMDGPRQIGAVLSPNEAVVSRAEIARFFDPDSLFAW